MGKNHVNKVKLNSVDGVGCTRHNGITSMTTSPILMKLGESVVYISNFWQTIRSTHQQPRFHRCGETYVESACWRRMDYQNRSSMYHSPQWTPYSSWLGTRWHNEPNHTACCLPLLHKLGWCSDWPCLACVSRFACQEPAHSMQTSGRLPWWLECWKP